MNHRRPVEIDTPIGASSTPGRQLRRHCRRHAPFTAHRATLPLPDPPGASGGVCQYRSSPDRLLSSRTVHCLSHPALTRLRPPHCDSLTGSGRSAPTHTRPPHTAGGLRATHWWRITGRGAPPPSTSISVRLIQSERRCRGAAAVCWPPSTPASSAPPLGAVPPSVAPRRPTPHRHRRRQLCTLAATAPHAGKAWRGPGRDVSDCTAGPSPVDRAKADARRGVASPARRLAADAVYVEGGGTGRPPESRRVSAHWSTTGRAQPKHHGLLQE